MKQSARLSSRGGYWPAIADIIMPSGRRAICGRYGFVIEFGRLDFEHGVQRIEVYFDEGLLARDNGIETISDDLDRSHRLFQFAFSPEAVGHVTYFVCLWDSELARFLERNLSRIDALSNLHIEDLTVAILTAIGQLRDWRVRQDTSEKIERVVICMDCSFITTLHHNSLDWPVTSMQGRDVFVLASLEAQA